MNANNPASKLIFRDQPLSDFHVASALHEACQESFDGFDALLHVFLVLCMLTALLICGWKVNTWQNAAVNTLQPAVAAAGFCVSGQHVF